MESLHKGNQLNRKKKAVGGDLENDEYKSNLIITNFHFALKFNVLAFNSAQPKQIRKRRNRFVCHPLCNDRLNASTSIRFSYGLTAELNRFQKILSCFRSFCVLLRFCFFLFYYLPSNGIETVVVHSVLFTYMHHIRK